MFQIVLYEPEIPPNTGNIMRLSANTNSRLHLIHPLGFELEERRLRRAGLDYRDMAVVEEHEDYNAFLRAVRSPRIYALTTKGKTAPHKPRYCRGDAFLFGPETRGLPDSVLDTIGDAQKIRVPMTPDSRSLNLANAVAMMIYEALRQHDFEGLV